MRKERTWKKLGVWAAGVLVCLGLAFANPMSARAEGDTPIYSLSEITDMNSFLYQNCPTTGDVKGLVFMVDFSDDREYGITQEQVWEAFNGNADENSENYPYESVATYYERSSFGKLHLSFDVFGEWYHFERERNYYSLEYDGDNGISYYQMVEEVLKQFDGQIDYSEYDANHDGYIDLIYLVCAGPYEVGVAGVSDWRSFVSTERHDGEFDGEGRIKTAYVKLDVRTIIHETGHMLGLGDYYNEDSGKVGFSGEMGMLGGLGGFDMMDSNMGDQNIVSKLFLGWVDPVFVTSDTEIDLYSVSDERAKAYIITPNKDSGINSEYYVVEYYVNEKNNSFSADAKGGAIRIYHVDANTVGNQFIYNNYSTDHKFISLIEADAKNLIALYDEYQFYEDYYYAGMSFGVNTAPSSDFYGGVFSGINVNVEKIEGESAKIVVTFSNSDNEFPQVVEEQLPKVFNRYVKFLSTGKLFFNSNVYPVGGFETMKGVKKGTSDYFDIAVDVYNNMMILYSATPLEVNSEYVLTIPAGSLRDAYGNQNEQIDIEIETLPSNKSYTFTDKWDLSVAPDNLPDDFVFLPKEQQEWFTFSNGDRGVLQFAGKEDDIVGDNCYQYLSPILKIFDGNGDAILNKHIDIPFRLGTTEKAYQLNNDKILLSSTDIFYILDREGNIEKSEACTESGYSGWGAVTDRGQFIDIWQYDTDIVCRIHKDGEVERFSVANIPNHNSLLSEFEFFSDDYENIKESDWIINQVGEYKNVHIVKKNVLLDKYRGGIGSAGVGSVANFNSYIPKLTIMHDIQSALYENSSNYPLHNFQVLNNYSCGPAGVGVHALSDGGFILDIWDILSAQDKEGNVKKGFYTSLWDGRCIIRLNDQLEVMWTSAVPEGMGEKYECRLSKGKIIIYSAVGTMVFDDASSETLVSHNRVMFEGEGIAFNEKKMEIVSLEAKTAQELVNSISGDYCSVQVYKVVRNEHQGNKVFLVSDYSEKITDAVIEVFLSDGLYVDYYHFKIGGALKGEVTFNEYVLFGGNAVVYIDNCNNSGTLHYQWYRNDVLIEGANRKSYSIGAEDDGQELTCVITSSDQEGFIQGTVKVQKMEIKKNTGRAGDTLWIGTDEYNAIGVGGWKYKWKRGDELITDATDENYNLVAEDIGKIISCIITSSEGECLVVTLESVVMKYDGLEAPWNLEKTDASVSNVADGKLVGTTPDMEYATKEDFSDAKPCGDGETTGLMPGDYYVRFAETETQEAGAYGCWTIGYEKEALVGELRITGRLKSYEVIGVEVTGGNVIYPATVRWFKNGELLYVGGTYDGISIEEEDFGKEITITCEVSDDYHGGVLTASLTGTVGKGDGENAGAYITGVTRPTVKGAADGRINGTTAGMEYATQEDFSDAKQCGDGETGGLAAGTYYVRFAETEYREAGEACVWTIEDGDEPVELNGNATVEGTLRYGQKIWIYIQSSNCSGDLSYQWKRGGVAIEGANAGSYTLTVDDIGRMISCEITSSVQTGALVATADSAIGKGIRENSGINDLTCIAASRKGAADAKLVGTTAEMEYATQEDFSDAKPCGGGATIGLKAGDYFVRYAETETVEAGLAGCWTIEDGPEVLTGSIVITKQPENITVAKGASAMFSVTATGEGLTYLWQYELKGSTEWVDWTSKKTATISVAYLKTRDGMTLRCVITDKDGNSVTSDEATLTYGTPVVALAITKQPESINVAKGTSASFSVTATGEDLAYLWRYKLAGSTEWVDWTSKKTATISVAYLKTRDGMKLRCVITDKGGNSVTSDEATLTYGTPVAALAITKQPESINVAKGASAPFSVTAIGEGLTYLWQYKLKGSDAWVDWKSKTTPSISVAYLKTRDGMKLRCVVTDKSGNSLTSNEATLTYGTPATALAITKQPESINVAKGASATFSVTATGEELTYLWQYKLAGSTEWVDWTSKKTAAISVAYLKTRDGMKLRCVIADKGGNSVTSDEATLTYGTPAAALAITKQPESIKVTKGTSAPFSVTATGEGLTYLWQYKLAGSTEWVDWTSKKTASITVAYLKTRDGMKLRCVITDKGGNSVTSDEATLTY